MPRHFFLRDSKNFPIACVATTQVDAGDGLAFRFAVATYNPEDFDKGPKWDRNTAKNRAIGRLNSGRHNMTIAIPPWEIPQNRAKGGLEVKRRICEDIASGQWRKDHPHAVSAHKAAQRWLDSAALAKPSTLPPIINRDFVPIPASQPDGHVDPVREALTNPEALGFVPIAEISCPSKIEVAPAPNEVNIIVSEGDKDGLDSIFASPHAPCQEGDPPVRVWQGGAVEDDEEDAFIPPAAYDE